MPFCTSVTVSLLLDGVVHKQWFFDNQYQYHSQGMYVDDNNPSAIYLTQHLQNIDLDLAQHAKQKFVSMEADS